MKYQDFESLVRKTTSFIWEHEASPETINGVKVDCVCKISNDQWITVEITQENTLDKLRTDLAKFASIRPYLFSTQNIYTKCYFVTEHEPNPSLKDTGKGLNVTVLSFDSFQKLLFDYDLYYSARSIKPFGSAIQPNSGQKDTITYVPVEYRDPRHNRSYHIEDLARFLLNSMRIILTGDYGTGKSRCIQEIFSYLYNIKAK